MDCEEGGIFDEFLDIDIDTPEKRIVCKRCKRPNPVCWCPFLPKEPLSVSTKIIILQHKHEEKRPLRTAPMLENSLEAGKCVVLRGSNFALNRHDLLKRAAANPSTLLLFPTEDAVDIQECIPASSETPRTLIVLDGTWKHAKGIYFKNPWLRSLKEVKLNHSQTSEYVIRTQPTDDSLSTLESAALALSILEQRPDIYQTLVQPLRALCSYQMDHGAVVHQSKQYLIENGLYKKQPLKLTDRTGRSRRRHRTKRGSAGTKEHSEHPQVSLSETHESLKREQIAHNCDTQGPCKNEQIAPVRDTRKSCEKEQIAHDCDRLDPSKHEKIAPNSDTQTPSEKKQIAPICDNQEPGKDEAIETEPKLCS